MNNVRPLLSVSIISSSIGMRPRYLRATECRYYCINVPALISHQSSRYDSYRPTSQHGALQLHTLQCVGMWTELLYFYHFLSIENQTKCIFGILVWEWKVNLLILTRVINLINLSFCAAFNQTSSNPFNTFPSNIYAEASTTLQQVAEKKIDKCVITSVAVSAETSQWWITLEYQERKQVSMY